MGWGEFGFNCWRVIGSALLSFLFYVNVSRMPPRSRLPSQPLTIPAPWVVLRFRRSIPLVNCLGFKVPTLVLFLFYVNASVMLQRSRLSYQPLTIPAPSVLFSVKGSIPLVKWFHPG